MDLFLSSAYLTVKNAPDVILRLSSVKIVITVFQCLFHHNKHLLLVTVIAWIFNPRLGESTCCLSPTFLTLTLVYITTPCSEPGHSSTTSCLMDLFRLHWKKIVTRDNLTFPDPQKSLLNTQRQPKSRLRPISCQVIDRKVETETIWPAIFWPRLQLEPY